MSLEMEKSLHYVNVYIPDALLKLGPFSERQNVYGYQHTNVLERRCRNEVQHTLVVQQTQHSSAHECMPCGASLLLLGEISSSCNAFSTSLATSHQYDLYTSAHSPVEILCSSPDKSSLKFREKSKNNSSTNDSAVYGSLFSSKACVSPDGVPFLNKSSPDLAASNCNLPQSSQFWLSFCSKPYLHLTKVCINGKDVSLQNVNIIFYSRDEIRGAQLLCHNYMSNSSANSSLAFFICKVKHESREKVPSSSSVEFFKVCVLVFIYLMKVLMFLPKQCVRLQCIFSKVFDFQSASLEQLSFRVNQLDEMQRICEMNRPEHQKYFVSSCCSCRFFHMKNEETEKVFNEQATKLSSGDSSYHQKYDNKAQTERKPHLSGPRNQHQKTCTDQNDTNLQENLSYQIHHKYSNCASTSCRCHATHTCSSLLLSPRSDTLVLVRLLCVVLFDVLLGLLLLKWMVDLGSADVIYSIFLCMAEHLSSGVLELLSWLRGAPAGLKLNQPLTVALASFFSYHVGLWTLYLEVAGGAVYSLCCALVYTGVLGASVQLALLSDLLHFATLHLHCFYVYAARLHMVQVSLLGSQWRAFRGNKWNPLKLRVDSLHSRSSPAHHPSRGHQPDGTNLFSSSKTTTEDDSTTRSSPSEKAENRSLISSVISQTTGEHMSQVNIGKSFLGVFRRSEKKSQAASCIENDSCSDNETLKPTRSSVHDSNVQISRSLGRFTTSEEITNSGQSAIRTSSALPASTILPGPEIVEGSTILTGSTTQTSTIPPRSTDQTRSTTQAKSSSQRPVAQTGSKSSAGRRTQKGSVTSAVSEHFSGVEREGSRAKLSRVVSAIIFTLVVFLLPTTTVYYVVFLSLRLLLLVARELLRLLPWLIHHNPAFAPCVLLWSPRSLAGEVEFRAVPDSSLKRGSPVALRVGARTSDMYSVVTRFAASHCLPALGLPSLASIISSVLWAGELL